MSLSTESNSPIVATGDDADPTVTLPDGRYLVSVRSLDHKMWGAYFTLPNDIADDGTALTVRVDLTVQSEDNPLPLGKIRVFVFNDNAWTNGAPDTEEGGLGGFKVGLEEQTGSAVTVDYNNDPLCGGICLTSNAAGTLGFAEIDNLGPATYFIDVHPPVDAQGNDIPCNPSNPDSRWHQTTTIDGGLSLMAPTEEGADGTGAPGEQLWEPPNIRTAYWFGFVCAPHAVRERGHGRDHRHGPQLGGVGALHHRHRQRPGREPVRGPLRRVDRPDRLRRPRRRRRQLRHPERPGRRLQPGHLGRAAQLHHALQAGPRGPPAQTVDVNDTDDDGSVGVGVSRWFGWLDGDVYKDLNGNGKYDAGIDAPIANTDMDQRWRDGSIKEATFTDPSGYYEYPTAEGGALGRWIINEQGFARFSAYPGASTHDEHTGAVTPSCFVTPPPSSRASRTRRAAAC